MQQIRLVALDLDGTVFNDQKEITPRTLAAIQSALQKGVVVLPPPGVPWPGYRSSSSKFPVCAMR